MSEQYIKSVVEAGLLAAGRSLGLDELAQLFSDGERPPSTAIRAALAALEQDYSGRAIELRETASGVRVQVRREYANEVARLWPERPQRYSRALLETLSLIAYRQPITRAEIEAVRGVAVNPNIIRTLLERNWVRVLGHRELPGRPELLGTTREFLDYFGLRTLSELPPLAELRGLEEIAPQLTLPVGLTEEAASAEPATAESATPAPAASEYEFEADDEGGEAPDVSAAPGMVASGPSPAD
jgi:segregation and condensation protein B